MAACQQLWRALQLLVAHPVRASGGDDQWHQVQPVEQYFLLSTTLHSAPPVLSVMIIPSLDLIGAVLLILGPVAFFIPSNILLMLPVSATC